jgi:DNA transformation protein
MRRALKKADSSTPYVLDQLTGWGKVEARSMFGGKGLYQDGVMFGLIDEGRLYFRVSPSSVGEYLRHNKKPFEPWPGHVMKGYYEVPLSVLEDPAVLIAWAKIARATPRAKARPPVKK